MGGGCTGVEERVDGGSVYGGAGESRLGGGGSVYRGEGEGRWEGGECV